MNQHFGPYSICQVPTREPIKRIPIFISHYTFNRPGGALLGRKTLLIMANNVAGGILGYIILMVIARYMTDAAYTYGTVAFALGFLGMFMIILSPGTDMAHIKRISEGKDVGKCVGTYLVMKVIFTAIFLIVVLTCLFGWKNILQQGFESPKHRIAIYLLIFNYVVSSFNTVFVTTFEARKETAKVEIGMLFSTITRLAAVMIVVYFQMGIYGLAITWNISMLMYFLVSLAMFRGYKIKKPSWKLAKQYIHFGLPILFISLSNTLAVSTDRVMIQYWRGSEEVGYYFAVWRITVFIILFGVATRKLIFPTISEYHAKMETKNIQNLTWDTEKYIALFIAPISLFMAFFPKEIIRIMLSEEFLPGAPILRILSIYCFIHALSIPYGAQIAGTNRPRISAALGIPKALLNILVNLLLIPSAIFGIRLGGLGAVGAALGTLISMTAYTVAVRIVVYKYILKTKSNWKIVFNIIAAGVMSLFLRFVLAEHYPIRHFYDFPVYAVIGAVLYFALMFAFRQFTKKEINYLLQVINPGAMLVYIRQELFRKNEK